MSERDAFTSRLKLDVLRFVKEAGLFNAVGLPRLFNAMKQPAF